MLTVIQPPFGFSALAWVAIVPFILVCSPTVKPGRLALTAYLVSLCYWFGNLYWLAPVTVSGWAAFCLYTAILWPALALCLRYCRIKKIPLFIAAPILVVGTERLQGLFLGGFFWRFLAHSQYANITIIQIADIFGTSGVSFLIAMVNGLLAELILDAISCHPECSEGSGVLPKTMRFFAALRMTYGCVLLKTALVCAALLAAVVYGRWRINQADKFIEVGPLVAAVQSNVPQSVKESLEAGDVIFDELLRNSKQSAEAGAELIVWPETMVQAILDKRVWPFLVSAENERKFDKALGEHSKDTCFVLVGAPGASPQIKEDGTVSFKRYNSAFLYKPDGSRANKKYNKIHLVPFGEVVPFKNSCPLLHGLLMKFTPYDYDYTLDYGREYTVFEMAAGKGKQAGPYKFSVMICYEDAVPAIARRFAIDERGRKRLDWLLNISNDGWFVRFKNGKIYPSTELAQHAAICVFRAVENRLAVLRSVNTGISCLIDTTGRIKNGYAAGTLPYRAMDREAVAGWFVDRVPIDKRITFFSKYGQWLDFCCAVCLVALIIVISLEAKFSRSKK
ncbi:MAG: apolipoprotein N-acyltransferase [Planctomycetota bacterium]|nr:MAG: apolipoprotein N-acyltransferase [Planctomycetota bacterium]